jgi:hypothetical protein
MARKSRGKHWRWRRLLKKVDKWLKTNWLDVVLALVTFGVAREGYRAARKIGRALKKGGNIWRSGHAYYNVDGPLTAIIKNYLGWK